MILSLYLHGAQEAGFVFTSGEVSEYEFPTRNDGFPNKNGWLCVHIRVWADPKLMGGKVPHGTIFDRLSTDLGSFR